MQTENKDREAVGPYLASGLAAVLIWSTSFVGTKIAYSTFPPLTLGACRFILATILLAAVVGVRKQLAQPKRGDLKLLALSGFLGITMYFAMENIGVSLTSASNAALICASYPAITILLERVIYGIKFTRMKALGVAMAIFGVYLIASQDGGNLEGSKFIGNIILFVTGFVWAFYNFVTRKVVNTYPALTVSFYQTLFGTIAFIPLALVEYKDWRMPTPGSFAVLMYLGILCSVAAYMLYNYGLRRLSASTAVTLINLVPVFGVLLSVLILGETVRKEQLIGGAIVIAGVILSVRNR